MASIDPAIVKQTAETLLSKIEEVTKNVTQPAYLRDLAEAFSLVVGNVHSEKAVPPAKLGGFA